MDEEAGKPTSSEDAPLPSPRDSLTGLKEEVNRAQPFNVPETPGSDQTELDAYGQIRPPLNGNSERE